MDKRLLQQLEEMERELDAFQSALESIEESKELAKESTLTLKEAQVTLSRACEEFIPVLKERFDNFAADSTSTQSKIEGLLTKLQSLDVHQFSEKLDNNGAFLTEQITTQLNTQNENLKSAVNEASLAIVKSNEEVVNKLMTDNFNLLITKLNSAENKFDITNNLVKQVRIISIAMAILCICTITLTSAKLFF